MSPNLALLLSTCDAYEAVARHTLDRLATWWPGHPRAWICGLSQPTLGADRCLPFTGDPRDWVGITRQAVTALESQGVEWLYLVLDDHPPFGPCHTDYLNRQLPETAVRLGAIQVNLQGWDQDQPQAGTALGAADLHWQRNAEDFRWKFSLHPGFWHVPTLVRLLGRLRAGQPAATSARAFEGGLSRAAHELDPALCARTYRVRGEGYAAGGRWFERRGSRWLVRQGIHLTRWCARRAGAATLERLDGRLVSYLRYLNGPYPMFWSGLVQAGRLNQEALRFLEWSGQRAVADAVRALPTPGAPPP